MRYTGWILGDVGGELLDLRSRLLDGLLGVEAGVVAPGLEVGEVKCYTIDVRGMPNTVASKRKHKVDRYIATAEHG